MKLLVFGAGAVGGYFGTRMVQAGLDVTFFVRVSRACQLKKHGLSVLSPSGNVMIAPKLITEHDDGQNFDLIILTCKSYDLVNAFDAISNSVKNEPPILPLLNGLAHLQMIAKVFGKHRLLGGAAHVATVLTQEGKVKQLNPIEILTIGTLSSHTESVVERFTKLCKTSTFKVIKSSDIMQSMWDKWTFLAALAGSTILFRNTVGAITETSLGCDLMKRIYDECINVANAEGFDVEARPQKTSLSILMKPGSDFTSSMLRDLKNGNRTEHEQILGDLLKKAKKKQIDVPLLSAAYISIVVESSKFAIQADSTI